MKGFGQNGFTLPELVTVIAVFLVLLLISAVMLHPKTYDAQINDAERHIQMANLVQAINRYQNDTGHLPEGITKDVRPVASNKDMLDLCKVLVPHYISDMPIDPLIGAKFLSSTDEQTTKRCDTEGVLYSTGFTVRVDEHGRVIAELFVQDESTEPTSIRGQEPVRIDPAP